MRKKFIFTKYKPVFLAELKKWFPNITDDSLDFTGKKEFSVGDNSNLVCVVSIFPVMNVRSFTDSSYSFLIQEIGG